MQAEKMMICELVNNYPIPCIYFDSNGACQEMNQHSAEFFSRWHLECSNFQDMCEILETDIKGSGKVLLRYGCIEYSLIPFNGGNIFTFESRSISNMGPIPFGIFVIDVNCKIVDHNSRCKEIFGYIPATVKSFDILKARRSEDGVKLSSSNWSMVKALRGIPTEGEFVDIVKKGGQRTTIYISSHPVKDHEGKIIGSVSYVQDASQHKEAEMQAIDAKFKAEKCLKEIVQKIKETSSESELVKLKTAAEYIYKTYLVESDAFPSDTIDVSYLLDAAGYECEKDLNNGTTVICKPEGNRLIIGNSDLKDAFKSIINNIAVRTCEESEITITIKDYCEIGREYHRIEIKDELAENLGNKRGLIECCDHSDFSLAASSRIIKCLGGRVWAEVYDNDKENYSKFIIIIPSVSCTSAVKSICIEESFAY